MIPDNLSWCCFCGEPNEGVNDRRSMYVGLVGKDRIVAYYYWAERPWLNLATRDDSRTICCSCIKANPPDKSYPKSAVRCVYPIEKVRFMDKPTGHDLAESIKNAGQL